MKKQVIAIVKKHKAITILAVFSIAIIGISYLSIPQKYDPFGYEIGILESIGLFKELDKEDQARLNELRRRKGIR